MLGGRVSEMVGWFHLKSFIMNLPMYISIFLFFVTSSRYESLCKDSKRNQEALT